MFLYEKPCLDRYIIFLQIKCEKAKNFSSGQFTPLLFWSFQNSTPHFRGSEVVMATDKIHKFALKKMSI